MSAPPRFGVVRFPGSNCDDDVVHAVRDVLGGRCEIVWHKERALDGLDVIVLPGGFSYGDYLRTGAIARFAPVMEAVLRFAADGGAVIGVCNGFQILCEAGLLEGALLRNADLKFAAHEVALRVESDRTVLTGGLAGQVLRMPIAHGEGRYFHADPERLEREGRVVFRYLGGNPNGSLHDIAGVANAAGNVVGLMPHPERACERLLGSDDGRELFLAATRWAAARRR